MNERMIPTSPNPIIVLVCDKPTTSSLEVHCMYMLDGYLVGRQGVFCLHNP